MTFSFPSGSSLYLIFSLIHSLSFAPVTGPDDSDDVFAVSETHRQYPACDLTETVMALLTRAMGQVLGNHAVRVGKGKLRRSEWHAVLLLVLSIFLCVPLETHLCHRA